MRSGVVLLVELPALSRGSSPWWAFKPCDRKAQQRNLRFNAGVREPGLKRESI